jgi:hypothetical protein
MVTMKNPATQRSLRLVCWTLIGSLILQPCIVAIAQAEDKCATNLSRAQAKFDGGEFDASIALVQECLRSKDASDEQKVKGYELLGQNYLSKGSTSQADDAIRKLLAIESDYRPNPDQTSPNYVSEVEKIRNQMGSTADSGGGFPWLYVVGGAVVVGVVVALIVSKSSDDGTPAPTELPGPPPRP